MIIKIRFDEKIEEFAITEEECNRLIECDYKERASKAVEDESVSPRSVQEILDERFNRPEYNSFQRIKRNTCSLEAFGEEASCLINPSTNPALEQEHKELLETIRIAISTLTPKQQNLLRKVFYEGMTEAEVARIEGVTKSAVSQRMKRIYDQLRRKMINFDFDH